MAKVLLWGPALWAKTAYGKNQLELAKRLKAEGHEVAQFAFGGLQWGHVEYEGIHVYPNEAGDYGQTWLPRWAHFFRPDLIIFHYDCWVLGASFADVPLPICWWSPVDHSPLPPPIKQTLAGQKTVIAITRFAQKELKAEGIESIYIPHSFDHTVYRPGEPGDQAKIREKYGFPVKDFVFASIATNRGPRKNLGNLLRAFRQFLDRVPEAWENAHLYLHCNVYGGGDNPTGYNLPQIWSGLKIAERIKYAHSVYYQGYGFTEEEMAEVYRMANWTVLCSLGEGFGLPLVESLGCGTPVIYGNYSAMPEVIGPGGLPVEYNNYMPFELSSSFQWVPSTEGIADRMVEAYRDWQQGGQLREELGARGRRHVLNNYTWGHVMPQWLELLAEKPAKPPLELHARAERRPDEVDVIVLTYNGRSLLERCLTTLYQNTQRPFHLVVIDDVSEDDTDVYMQGMWEREDNLTYIRLAEKARGGAEAMNKGYKYCRNDLIVSMNNDIMVEPGWLEEPVRCMADPRVGIVGMKFLYPESGDMIQHAGGTFIRDIPCHVGCGERRGDHSETRPMLWVSGPCVLIRREILGEDGWDEDFDSWGGHEDIDICLRARKHGYQVLYCGAAVVYHHEGATLGKDPSNYRQRERARQVFLEKWLGSPLLRESSLAGS